MDVASTTGLQFYGTTEKNGIVIEIGSVYTKVGFVGESHPRAIIRTDLQSVDGNKISLSLQNDSQTNSFTKKQWKEAIETFLNSIYFHYLQTSPKERRVVICDSLLGMTILKEVLTETLFEKFKVPSVAFLSSESLSLIPLSLVTALVVDSGYSETKVLPVYERVALTAALRSVPIGSHTVHNKLFQLLKDHVTVKQIPELKNVPFSLLFNEMPNAMIEDITVKLCYADKFSVHQDVNQPQTWPKAPENKEHAKYKLKNKNPAKKFSGTVETGVKYNIKPDTWIEIADSIRKEPVNSLFEGDEEENSVATVVLDSLLKCDPDTRLDLSKNILLVGGNTMYKGFSTRLQDELNYLVENNSAFSELKGLKGQFNMLSPIFPANYLTWLGASVLGSLEYINTFSTTLENYKK